MSTIAPPLRSAVATPRGRSILRAALIAVLLSAFALRAWRLDFQSLWSDEGISLNRSALPFAEMLAGMPVEHAPGYFVALHAWMMITGQADYALRYLSLIPGVLAIALIFRTAVELASPVEAAPWIALSAAVLAATNAFLIAYAQEARMYAWLIAAALASTWSLWRILHNPVRRGWMATLYALSVASCVYLHYYGAFVAIAQALYVAGWVLVTRRWRPALWWLGAAAAGFILFLPWLPRALGVTSFAGWREPGDVAGIPLHFARAYLSASVMPESLTWAFWVLTALAALGIVWWVVRRPAAGFLLLALLAVPLLAVILLALRNPDFHERYTAYLAPILILCVSAGVIALNPATWRDGQQARGRPAFWIAPAIVAALLIAANLAATWRQATDVSLHKPDYRAAAARIQSNQQSGDVILVDGPNPALVFNHYYTGGLPVVDLRDLEGASGDAVDARLREVTANAQRAWEVLYFHAPGPVQVWLATRAWATNPTDHNGIRVTLYGLAQSADPTTAQNLEVGPALQLVDSSVAPQTAPPGGLVRVTTNWFTRSSPPDYKFSMRVVDESGNVIDTQDYVPQNWFAPTSVWVVNAGARDQRGIALPHDLPPGAYDVTLRVYDAASGEPVSTAAGTDIPLGSFTVETP